MSNPRFCVDMTENDRLRVLQKELGFKSQAAFAAVLGIKQGSLSDVYRAKSGIGVSDSIKRILEKDYSINIGWLERGEGEMLKSESLPKPHGGANIPFYDIDVTASITEAFCDTPEIPQYYINFPPLNDCTAAFPVYGESMEPDFYAGEVVLVKEVTNVDSMLWGEPYLVITNANCDNLRTIKNVYLSDDRQKFILRATNPRYAGDTIVPRNDVLKIFLVKGKVNRRQL